MSDKTAYDFGKSSNNLFDYNIFYGSNPDSEPKDPHKITADPLFVDPGSGSLGINSLEGYLLKNGSPALNSGKEIPNPGTRDFWGNRLTDGKPDRGAHEKR